MINRYLITCINEPMKDETKEKAIKKVASAIAVNSHLSHYITVGDQWTSEDVDAIRRQAHKLLGNMGPAPKVFSA